MSRVWFVALCLAMLSAGCKSGQQQRRSGPPPTFMPQGAQQMNPNMAVIVRGEVHNPIVPWNEDLTLARAILAADYYGQRDPHSIALIRNGRSRRFSTSRLLSGEDMFLEPGDVVEIRR